MYMCARFPALDRPIAPAIWEHPSTVHQALYVVGDIFGLLGIYFNNIHYHRANIAEIQNMLDVLAMNLKYKTFPLVLFLGIQEDAFLNTVFWKWGLLAKKAALCDVTSLYQGTTGGPKTNPQKWNFEHTTPGSIMWAASILSQAIFLLSPNTEFQKSDLGKSSDINYKDLFFYYKKLLLMNSVKSSASAASQEDLSSEVICTMNTLNMSESDISTSSSMVQGATVFQSDIIEAQLLVYLTPALSTVSSLSTTSTLSATFKVSIQDVMVGPVATTTVIGQDADVRQKPVQACYIELVQYALDELLEESDSEDDSYSTSSNDSGGSISMSVCSMSSDASLDSLMSGITITSAYSSQLSSDGPQMAGRAFTEFIDAVHALADKVETSRVLKARPKLSRAPQLHLLPEWGMHAPDKFLRKLRVSPAVFDKLIEHIQPHAIFYNNSNNPQLPIPIQLAIFLNGIGHYGNAATMQDLAEWAGVSIRTVYNCFK
ncbi:uncharacterized protein F5891DRAFT_1180201 [Suillus fuscotomentosus]|uniref:Uncharacterized protein n=1 Tax=Suillus fuscotomentosus TaxID=1912939 RepID=A0AAD4HUK0_9AGAM|nr:uncharacterized protein F5891DRAFT_1180201 [Suillus fuscotomentosus]KAG1908666.1 hypothetical protein F5891DRAFT_1180201 [Suillus fuscotomentosus]